MMTSSSTIGLAILGVLLLMCVPSVYPFTRDKETTLRTRLLDGYGHEVRPSSVTEVSMLFHVTSISVVDIRNEIFSVSGWWSMHWMDDRLTWTDYPNIPVVQFKETRMWTPVIVVSNSVDDLSAIGESSIPVRVDRNGSVNWNPPGLIRVSCTMDVTYFPFDTQTCAMEVTSFGYTIQEMDVKLYGDGLSFRYYSQNGEWDIERTYSKRAEYEEDGYNYARIVFYFEISRKPLFYGLNMLLPVIVCAALILFVFLLPAESGEKIGYCLTVLLAFMVILTLVAEDLPTTASSTSILQVYIALVLSMGGLSVIMSIITLHLFFLPEEQPVGPYTCAITRFCRRLTCQADACGTHPRVGPTGTGPMQHADHPGYDRPKLVKDRTMDKFRPNSGHRGNPRDSQDDDVMDDVTITWQLVSRTMDAVLFRLYALFLVVSVVVFVTVLVTGHD